MSDRVLNRLLVTGASGRVGTILVPLLRDMAGTLRLSGRNPVAQATADAEDRPCDLSDATAVDALVAGCDGIVHLGGVARESDFDAIVEGNIRGMQNLYQAAQRHGQPRIVYASSNHVVGFYPWEQTLGTADAYRPDTLYGVSKVFGEALAQYYYDKFGQQTAVVRIGSTFPQPTNHRMLQTWFSAADFARLIRAVFTVPHLGCPIIWGVSNNNDVRWRNGDLGWLGWQPTDSSVPYRAGLSGEAPAADDPAIRFHGGGFAKPEPGGAAGR